MRASHALALIFLLAPACAVPSKLPKTSRAPAGGRRASTRANQATKLEDGHALKMDDAGARSRDIALKTPRGGEAGVPPGTLSVTNLALLALVGATAFSYRGFALANGGGGGNAGENADYAAGLMYSGIALIGNTGVSTLRKILARHVGNAQQVGIATLIQGIGAAVASFSSGQLSTPPPKSFWAAAVCSSCLNALVKTLETKVCKLQRLQSIETLVALFHVPPLALVHPAGVRGVGHLVVRAVSRVRSGDAVPRGHARDPPYLRRLVHGLRRTQGGRGCTEGRMSPGPGVYKPL